MRNAVWHLVYFYPKIKVGDLMERKLFPNVGVRSQGGGGVTIMMVDASATKHKLRTLIFF